MGLLPRQVRDLYALLDPLRREAEDLAVEVKFAVEGAADVLGLAEAVARLRNGHRDRQAALGHGVVHHLRLVGRHDLVLAALEEDHGTVICQVMDRRALEVDIARRGRGRRGGPGSATRTCACRVASASRSLMPKWLAPAVKTIAEGQRARASCSRPRSSRGWRSALRSTSPCVDEVARAVDAVVDVDDAPRPSRAGRGRRARSRCCRRS